MKFKSRDRDIGEREIYREIVKMEKKDWKDTVSMCPDILDQYHRQKKTKNVGGGGGRGHYIFNINFVGKQI